MATKASSKTGRSILIVEDEPFLSDMYKAKLSSLGYKVSTAMNGQDALQQLHEKKPDLVLLDVIMPEMDGYTVLKKVRSDPSLRDLLIVMFSNLGQDEEITKGLQMGADDYLVKSNFTPSEVVKKLDAIIARGHSEKGTQMQPIRVLLVAKPDETITLYTERCDREGFVSKLAEDSNLGLQYANKDPYDVILVDLTNPELGGDNFLKTLQATPKLKEVPVLVLSNSVDEKEIAQIQTEGATDVYLKPRVTPTQIINRIRELAKR